MEVLSIACLFLRRSPETETHLAVLTVPSGGLQGHLQVVFVYSLCLHSCSQVSGTRCKLRCSAENIANGIFIKAIQNQEHSKEDSQKGKEQKSGKALLRSLNMTLSWAGRGREVREMRNVEKSEREERWGMNDMDVDCGRWITSDDECPQHFQSSASLMCYYPTSVIGDLLLNALYMDQLLDLLYRCFIFSSVLSYKSQQSLNVSSRSN